MAIGSIYTAPGRRTIVIILSALMIVLTAAGVAKPILWDEAVYFQFAQHIVNHPFDPYGATIWVNGRLLYGLEVLAPPVMLYWWAAALFVFGDNINVSAIALAPFAAVYVAAFYDLARRFAEPVALAITVLASLSAWSLVTFSYMLDFPAVAVGLLALAIFIRGADGENIWLVILGGAIAGFAFEIKYNAAAICGAIGIYALLYRRFIDGLAAVGVAVGCVIIAEWLIAARYGQSHFLLHLSGASSSTASATVSRLRDLFYALFANNGPTLIGLLAATTLARDQSRAAAFTVASVAILAFVAAALGFDDFLARLVVGKDARSPTLLTLSGLLGVALAVQTVTLLLAHRGECLLDRSKLFLVGWLLGELAIYFAMSPFPAARRLGEVQAVLILLLGAFVANNLRGRISYLYVCVAMNAVAGAVMLSISLIDGWGLVDAAERARSVLRSQTAAGWEFTSIVGDIYLQRMDVPRVLAGKTNLQAGDGLLTELNFDSLDLSKLQQIEIVSGGVNLGIRVSTEFYRAKVPWVNLRDTRNSFVIYRATAPTIPLR